MKWLFEFFSPNAYDQGYRAGFKKGVQEGQDWGHEHGACEHTHPFDGALAALGHKRSPGFGTYHRPQSSTKGR